MRKAVPLAAMAAGIWLLASPWLYQGSSMGQMSGSMNSSSGVVVDASTYYWHILPGLITIVFATILLLRETLPVTRWIAGALFLVAVWAGFGPWVLPQLGLGETMNMGLTFRSFVLHVVPAVVLGICAIAALLLVPAGGAAETPRTLAGADPQR